MTTLTKVKATPPVHRRSRALPAVSRTVARRVLVLLPFAVLMIGFVSPVGAASAAPPPVFEPQLIDEKVFATRAHIVEEVLTGLVELEWHSEYAPAEADGSAPPAGSGAWVASGKGKTLPNGDGGRFPFSTDTFLGTAARGEAFALDLAVVRRLTPTTPYYARFHAKNEAGAAEATFKFTTPAAGKPEMNLPGAIARGSGNQLVQTKGTTPTTADFSTQIEANGAETTYSFEFAPAEAGHAPPENSLSWAPFTSGEVSGAVPATPFALAEGFAVPSAHLSGLAPESKYYARVKASNVNGEAVEVQPFSTSTAKPVVFTPTVRNVTGESAHLHGSFLPHGSETQWHFEYSTSPSGPWIPGAGGTLSQTVAESLPEGTDAQVGGSLAGLSPATTYYVRLFAKNAAGEGEFCHNDNTKNCEVVCVPIAGGTEGIASFKTAGPPTAATFAVHGLHGEALRVMGAVNPDSVPTSNEQTVTVEGAPTGGTFTLSFKGQTTGGVGIASTTKGSIELTGVAASSGAFTIGEAISGPGIPPGTTIVEPRFGQFTLSAAATETASGVAIASDLPYNADVTAVYRALTALLATGGEVNVEGFPGGPYTVLFYGHMGEVAQPQISADASGLEPKTAAVTVATVEPGGKGYDTHYHFEFVSQKQWEAAGGEGGFAKASSTPEVDIGSGNSEQYVGADLPSLEAGETHRFRIVATNTSPGNPVVRGEEQALTVPPALAVTPEAPGSCGNEALRTGLSAHLPDCRAFEQLTPVDKGGTQEIFAYGGTFGQEGAVPAEDGDHLQFGSASVKWGQLASSGQAPYFFSRSEAGWQVTASAAQPEAGVSRYTPQLLAPAMGSFAFESGWFTTPSARSPHTEFEVGAPGGPYVTAASVPWEQAQPGWVGASSDFSKLILQVADHVLLGHQTHTTAGDDLYEWSGGKLRQANVTGPAPGVTVGSCGATIAHEPNSEAYSVGGAAASATGGHAVSADGSRVFFEAVPPGKACSEPTHVYERVNGGGEGAQTMDLGAYRFVAADTVGATVLLEKPPGENPAPGENPGLYLYQSETGKAEFLPNSGIAAGGAQTGTVLTVSDDLSTVYVHHETAAKAQALYRYDVRGRGLRFITQISTEGPFAHIFYESSPDGRYFNFLASSVAGLPGGGVGESQRGGYTGQSSQTYRYDDAQALVQCLSCVSAFNPEPRLSAFFTQSRAHAGGTAATASANGDYVFFDTPAELVPSDIDGETAPEGVKSRGGEHGSDDYSTSSDVYEWRRYGINGCTHVQGCLALITSGHGGFLNILLGTSASGRDVFFSTNESLLPSDNDTAGDIYDARIGGGFPEPPRVVECQGDACSTPFAPPNDPSPSSAAFQGAGNLLTPSLVVAAPKPKCGARGGKKCKVRHKKRRRKARHTVRHATRTGGKR